MKKNGLKLLSHVYLVLFFISSSFSFAMDASLNKSSTTSIAKENKNESKQNKDNDDEEDIGSDAGYDEETNKSILDSVDTLTKEMETEQQDAKLVKIDQVPPPQKQPAPLPEADKPLSTMIIKTKADEQAKSMLEIADNHRNQRTNFSPIESWQEAFRLYKEVALNTSDVSPDLKARAIINLSEMTVWSIYGNTTVENKNEAFQNLNEIINNNIYSKDVRSWAKRHLAKLYLLDGIDFEPAQARKKSLDLYNEIIADLAISIETKARAMIQLAYHYVSLAFDVSNKEALEKATKLLTGVFENQKVRSALRADAKILLASIVNPHNDIKSEQRLKLLKELIADHNVPVTERSKAKERLAHYYLENTFDIPNAEARTHAHTLFKELAEQKDLSLQERISYYLQLAEHYIHVKLDLKPSVSRAYALKMYNELPSKIQLSPMQMYIYKKEMAHYCVVNAFYEDPSKAKQTAFSLYQELINDPNLPIQQKAEIHWILANLYITKQLEPKTGVDSKLEGLALIKKIINDPKIGSDIINQFKLNLSLLFEKNAFGLLPSRSREEAKTLLSQLLADDTISPVDKQQLQLRLDVLKQFK